MALLPPPRRFAQSELHVDVVRAADLFRISSYAKREPHFGRSGANRFDDDRTRQAGRFGTCYCGLALSVAFAETVLHDEVPVSGRFAVAEASLTARFVVTFQDAELVLADLTGAALKRSGIDPSISTTEQLDLTRRWAMAIHRHPRNVDGILYMSRHMNSHKAVAVFDRAAKRLQAAQYTPLQDFPGALREVLNFGVVSA